MHIQVDCLKLKDKDKEKYKSNESVQTSVSEDESDEIIFIVNDKLRFAYEWILDFGRTYHMYPNRNWFFTFEFVEGGVIMMGNDVVCKIARISMIRIKTHNGVVRTLT